jgi:tetratricopeptide (TPR) repeat protein
MSVGLHTPQLRRAYLRHVVTGLGLSINPPHLFLAEILREQDSEEWRAKWRVPFCRTLFTTNFDPLLQRSLQLVAKLYYMTDRPDGIEPPTEDGHDAIHLVYTHGSIHRYQLANTEDEIERIARRSPHLQGFFRDHGVIVIGYSGWNDVCMQALKQCPQFDYNLYWCDIHSPAEAKSRLAGNTYEFLEEHRGNSYYVHLQDGANGLLQALHRKLGLGGIPQTVIDPLSPLLNRLQSLVLSDLPSPGPLAKPGEAADGVPPRQRSSTSRSPAEREELSLDSAFEQSLEQLRLAKRVFDDPEEGIQDVEAAVVAKLMNLALSHYSSGEHPAAIETWNRVVDGSFGTSADRAKALFNIGIAQGEAGDAEAEIASYTRLLELPDVSEELRSKAYHNRAVTRGLTGDTAGEIADYQAVLELPGISVERRAKALLNRGVAYGTAGNPDQEVADFSAVLALDGAPDALKAKALFNRGVAWGRAQDVETEIADYSAVLELADAPDEQRAKALLNRGISLGKVPDKEAAIRDFSAILEVEDAPEAIKAEALGNLGWVQIEAGDFSSAVESCERALAISPLATWIRANLGLALLHLGRKEESLEAYHKALSELSSAAEVTRLVEADLRAAQSVHPELLGVEEVLEAAAKRRQEIS